MMSEGDSQRGSELTSGIDYFGRGHWLTDYQTKASLEMRRRIFDWAVDCLKPVASLSVLELGATPDVERADSNCFARWFLERGDHVTAASVEDITGLPDALSGLRVVAWPQKDGSVTRGYDLVVSSAVLEHTGRHDVDHVALALGLGHNVLLTTPNRWHWMEFHTKLPLLHWLPQRAHSAVLRVLGKGFWADSANLHLYSRGMLSAVCERAVRQAHVHAEHTEWYLPRFWGSVSNLVVFFNNIREVQPS